MGVLFVSISTTADRRVTTRPTTLQKILQRNLREVSSKSQIRGVKQSWPTGRCWCYAPIKNGPFAIRNILTDAVRIKESTVKHRLNSPT
jgi:hypothetical protein